MSKVLLLQSAGIDAAAALHALLVQGDPVLAVHVVMPYTAPHLVEVELYWVQQQWARLKGQGYEFDTLVVAPQNAGAPELYSVILLREAANLFLADPALTHVMSGRCAEDMTSSTRDWTAAWALFASMTGKSRTTVRRLSPFRDKTKALAAQTLPHGLLRTIWGCMRPIYTAEAVATSPEDAMQCGGCVTCQQYIAAGIHEEVYWIEPPAVIEAGHPIAGVDWDAHRPTGDGVQG